MKFLKAILLISAFLAVSLRLLAYENADFLGTNTAVVNTVAFVAAAVCIICAVIWAVILKKQEKEQKKEEKESEVNDV